jgi:hypothetical protein
MIRGKSEPYPADDDEVTGNPTFRIPPDDTDFALAEYVAVRADALQGRSGQQSILAWSIAAIGVLFAAGLAVKPSDVGHASTLRELIFGVAIPLVALGSCMAWLGEIYRMERDAHYLRLLERWTWEKEQRAEHRLTGKVPDRWVGRTSLANNAWNASGNRYNRVIGYFGGLLVYTSAVLGSVALCLYLVDHRTWVIWFLEVLMFLTYFVLVTIQVLTIFHYSRFPPVRSPAGNSRSPSPAPRKEDES